jgi:cytochrome P450
MVTYFKSVCLVKVLIVIFSETLRMYPPATMLGKQCTEEIQITYNKEKTLLIEKDMSVVIPLYSIHRDPEYYPNPDTFKPERFDAQNGGVKYFKDKGVYLPFGDGPRICLGMKFAFAQSKAAIVEIVEKFEILPSDKVQLPLTMIPDEFLNMPIGGLWAKFKPILVEWTAE